MARQPYKTKRTQGTRKRPSVRLTLAVATDKRLDVLAKASGLPRSRVVDALVLWSKAYTVLGLEVSP